ncbi:hypothetical protein F5888DRAFT_857780 [Russula emetica]|nr:hypothetical protein F5888DRAFT_857780 [Russula emetica]
MLQEKHQAWLDVVHVPKDVITVLGKRILDEDLNVLWDGLWYHENVLGEPTPRPNVPILITNMAHVHILPQGPADSDREWTESDTDDDSVHSYPSTVLASPDGESMELDDDVPPGSPESGHSHSPATSSESSTESEDWHSAPSSLASSDSDSDRWSTISNAPSADSLSENLKAADYELKGKAKVSRRISGTASGVDPVNAADMVLRSAVDPGPFPKN